MTNAVIVRQVSNPAIEKLKAQAAQQAGVPALVARAIASGSPGLLVRALRAKGIRLDNGRHKGDLPEPPKEGPALADWCESAGQILKHATGKAAPRGRAPKKGEKQGEKLTQSLLSPELAKELGFSERKLHKEAKTWVELLQKLITPVPPPPDQLW